MPTRTEIDGYVSLAWDGVGQLAIAVIRTAERSRARIGDHDPLAPLREMPRQ